MIAPNSTPRRKLNAAEVMRLWADVLPRLGDDPATCSADLDWVAKQQVMEGYRERDGLDWSDPRLRAVDIQWSDVRPEKGIYLRLEAAGRFDRVVTDAEIDRAVTELIVQRARQAGVVRVGGVDIRTLDATALRRRLVVCIQGSLLIELIVRSPRQRKGERV